MTSVNDLKEEFESQLNRLIGKPCWAIYAGKATGSNLDISFGRKIPRAIPLLGEHLTEDQRYHDAEFSLYITCAWRLDGKSKVICGATELTPEEGGTCTGLDVLVDKRVESVQLYGPAFDLTIGFEGFMFLKIFCDQTDADDEYCTNYSLHTREKIYVVGPCSQLRYEIPQRRM